MKVALISVLSFLGLLLWIVLGSVICLAGVLAPFYILYKLIGG